MSVRKTRPALFGRGIAREYDHVEKEEEDCTRFDTSIDQDCSKTILDSVLKEVEKASITITRPALFGRCAVKACDIVEQEDNLPHPDLSTEKDVSSISEVVDCLLEEVMNMEKENEEENMPASITEDIPSISEVLDNLLREVMKMEKETEEKETPSEITEDSVSQIDMNATNFNDTADAQSCVEYECSEPLLSEIRSLVNDLQINVEKYTFTKNLAESYDEIVSQKKFVDNFNNNFQKCKANQTCIQMNHTEHRGDLNINTEHRVVCSIEKKDAETQYVVIEMEEKEMQTCTSAEDRSTQTYSSNSTTETECQTYSSESAETEVQVEVEMTSVNTQTTATEHCFTIPTGISPRVRECMNSMRQANYMLLKNFLKSSYIDLSTSELKLYTQDGSPFPMSQKNAEQSTDTNTADLSPESPTEITINSQSSSGTKTTMSTPRNRTNTRPPKRPAADGETSSTSPKHSHFTRLSVKRKKD